MAVTANWRDDDHSLQSVEHAVAEEAAADVAAGGRLDARRRIRIQIIDGNVVPDAAGAIIAIADKRPITAIAVTVMPGPQLRAAVSCSRQLKRVLPGVPIIWGGYFPSQHADACLSEQTVDICVIGQGEQTIRELIRAISNGGSLSSIAGLATGERHDRRTPPRALTPLDELPDSHQQLPMEHKTTNYLGDRVATHHSSFGCPFACNFCAVVGMSNRKWVAQSPIASARCSRSSMASTERMRCSFTTWTSSFPNRARRRSRID